MSWFALTKKTLSEFHLHYDALLDLLRSPDCTSRKRICRKENPSAHRIATECITGIVTRTSKVGSKQSLGLKERGREDDPIPSHPDIIPIPYHHPKWRGKRRMRFEQAVHMGRMFKPPTQLERQQSMAAVGGPGFSRVVFCNDSEKHLTKPYRYKSNYVSTTKYNALTFFPKALFEQFRRVANLYFLLAAALALTPVSPYSASSLIAPLVFVVGVSMCKEALEDWRRFLQVSGSHLLTLNFPLVMWHHHHWVVPTHF